MILFCILFLGSFAVAVWVIVYLLVIRRKGMQQRCSAHTYGRIRRYSNIHYSGIPIPLVEYEVDSGIYKVAGPRFESVVVKTSAAPFADPAAQIRTNLTTRAALPKKLMVRIQKNSVISYARSPLQELYPIGAEDVDVYYNPSRPKEAYVQRYCEISKWLQILLVIVAILLTGLLFVTPSLLKKAGADPLFISADTLQKDEIVLTAEHYNMSAAAYEYDWISTTYTVYGDGRMVIAESGHGQETEKTAQLTKEELQAVLKVMPYLRYAKPNQDVMDGSAWSFMDTTGATLFVGYIYGDKRLEKVAKILQDCE